MDPVIKERAKFFEMMDKEMLSGNPVPPPSSSINPRESHTLHYDLSRRQQVCVIGAGHLGATTAAVLAYRNRDSYFIVVDPDKDLIDAWNSDEPPIQEPDLAELLAKVQFRLLEELLPMERVFAGTVNLEFSTEFKEAIATSDMIIVAVNTPIQSAINRFDKDESREWDLGHLDATLEAIGQTATSDKIVVLRSTVPCGTAQHARELLAKYERSRIEFHVLSNPELLSHERTVKDVLHPARVVIGSDAEDHSEDEATTMLEELYDRWVSPDRILFMSTGSAELSKLASNTMIAQRISNANALSVMCEGAGAAVSDVTKACGMDPRIGPAYLEAGLGFGGSCLEKDLFGLTEMARSMGLDHVAKYWDQVLEMNDYQQWRVLRKIMELYAGKMGAVKVACLGYGYKKGTVSPKGSRAKEFLLKLMDFSDISVSIYDAVIPGDEILAEMHNGDGLIADRVEVCESAVEACFEADLVLVTADAPEYRDLDWQKITKDLIGKRAVFDLRGVVPTDELAKSDVNGYRLGELIDTDGLELQ